MEASIARVFLDIEIRIVNLRVPPPLIGDSEQRDQTEVLPPLAPFIEQRRLVSRNYAAAALYILCKLPALCIRQRRDVREDQRAIAIDMRRIEQPVVRHVE